MSSDQTSRNVAAREKAMANMALMMVQPTELIEFQSRGKVLVIGGDQDTRFESLSVASAAGGRESRTLSDTLLASGIVNQGDVIFPAVGTPIAVSGYLGAFTVDLGTPGSANHEMIEADLILDLGMDPVLKTPLKPPGYLLADSRDESSVRAALDQLKDLVGTFEKPRYFDIDTNICAHSRSGQSGCTRCLDTCPAQAITSAGEFIEVDPHLCQGGGVCATVCPTGAIRYAYPSASDTLNQLRQVLKHYHDAGGQNPLIVFIAEADYQLYEPAGAWPDSLIPIVIEELASVGMDVWLGALAYGAKSVLLIDAGSVPEGVQLALKEQLGFARSLLDGMQYDDDLIQYIAVDKDSAKASIADLQTQDLPAMPDITLATFGGSNSKRQAMFMAIDHLNAQTGIVQEEILLPANAPFGRIQVDASRCTMCMGCTSVCPASAVNAGGDSPRLLFTEANCTQCGLCQSACPEQAIELQPRLLTDLKQRRESVVLNEESPFLCVSCSKPFATQSIINTIMAKLTDHSMFQSERAKQRLQMCEDCRVVDAVQDGDAMLAASSGRGLDKPTREH